MLKWGGEANCSKLFLIGTQHSLFPAVHLYAGESLGVMLQRWSKLEKV